MRNKKLTTIERFASYYRSPLGMLKITASLNAIEEVLFCEEDALTHQASLPSGPTTLIEDCIHQLDDYFAGSRKSFELPLEQPGTVFQQRVWNELMQIPYGVTISYLDLSRRLGNVKAIRAAASTNGRNRIAVIVPCHRVIGSNQQLVGYAGGLSKKRWLLEHELKFAHGKQTLF